MAGPETISRLWDENHCCALRKSKFFLMYQRPPMARGDQAPPPRGRPGRQKWPGGYQGGTAPFVCTTRPRGLMALPTC